MTDDGIGVQWGDRLYLDCETTGLNPPRDEVVEISIIDDHEAVFSTKVRPRRRKSWPDAQRVHGISPADVARAPAWDSDLLERIGQLVAGRQVVIYNAAFDTKFFPWGFWEDSDVQCCMLAFAKWEKRKRWRKLTEAADLVGHIWRGAAHGSLADCYATRDVWCFLQERRSGR